MLKSLLGIPSIDINLPIDSDLTLAQHLCLLHNDLPSLSTLSTHPSFDINKATLKEGTLLIMAVESQSVPFLNFILDHNPSVECVDGDNSNVFHYIAYHEKDHFFTNVFSYAVS